MPTKNLLFLLSTTLLILCACQPIEPQITTVEVTRVVKETHIAMVEVTRIVRETQLVTVEVTRLVPGSTAEPEKQPTHFSAAITEGAKLAYPRANHSATRLLDNRILLTGGSMAPDEHLAQTEILDPATGSITLGAPMHSARHDFSATLLLDGRVLVVGGYSLQHQWLQDGEIFDPSTNTWTITQPLYPHGVQHTATLLQDGRVLVIGGCIGSGVCTEKVELFTPYDNTWTEMAPLGADRVSHAAVLLEDGRVLVVGGEKPWIGDGLIFDVGANTWISTGQMIDPRIYARVVRLLDGRVLAAGGTHFPYTNNTLRSAEIYDPVSNTWSAAASLSQARYGYVLELLPDGQVVAVGGSRQYGSFQEESSFVGEIEIYDPILDRWYLAGNLPQPEAFLAAAFLPDDRLWITGGLSGQSGLNFWADTWLIGMIPATP